MSRRTRSPLHRAPRALDERLPGAFNAKDAAVHTARRETNHVRIDSNHGMWSGRGRADCWRCRGSRRTGRQAAQGVTSTRPRRRSRSPTSAASRSASTSHQRGFSITSADGLRTLVHVTEQDAFSANGTTLQSKPFTFSIHILRDADGNVMHAISTGQIIVRPGRAGCDVPGGGPLRLRHRRRGLRCRSRVRRKPEPRRLLRCASALTRLRYPRGCGEGEVRENAGTCSRHAVRPTIRTCRGAVHLHIQRSGERSMVC